MDLLISLPTSLPLVVPSTTIKETRHRSLPLYNRLQQLIQDEARTVWVWWNEERRETATFQEEDEVTGIEGINDRNDRGEYLRSRRRSITLIVLAIRKTLHFYNEHLRASTSTPPQLILLSDDRRNRELAQADGLIAISTREYVDGLVPEEREKLVDLVVGGVDELAPSERRAKRIYQEVGVALLPYLFARTNAHAIQYLPQDTLTAGVKSGRFFQGHYNANPYNYLEVSWFQLGVHR